jgi:hypothetical protein
MLTINLQCLLSILIYPGFDIQPFSLLAPAHGKYSMAMVAQSGVTLVRRRTECWQRLK